MRSASRSGMTMVVARCCAAPVITRGSAVLRCFAFSPCCSSRKPNIMLTSSFLGFIPRWQPRLSLPALSSSATVNPSCGNARNAEDPQDLLEARIEAGYSDSFNKTEYPHLDTYEFKVEDEDLHVYDELCTSHIPVLLSEVLEVFQDVQLHTFVDCTIGAAGHSSSIIKSHPELRTFVGLDVDPVAHSESWPRLQDAIKHRNTTGTDASQLNLHVLEANFRNVKNALHQLGLAHQEVDGVLMDLGMSSMQLNVAERGFSLQQDGPLDMRMDPSASLTASDILNDWPEAEIGRILRDYGEERQWKRLAWKISEAQLLGGIHSTASLLQLIQKSLPSRFSPGRAGWKKTAVRVFQALRIAVNDELSSLEAALPDAFECLKPEGRLAVISFHSLEDRIVKQFFSKVVGERVAKKSKFSTSMPMPSSVDQPEGRRMLRGGRVLEGRHATILTKRPLLASLDEVKLNTRARSAKLRILVKK